MTVDEIICEVRSRLISYYPWRIPQRDEILVAEIERLRKLVDYYSCALERADRALLTKSLDSGIM